MSGRFVLEVFVAGLGLGIIGTIIALRAGGPQHQRRPRLYELGIAALLVAWLLLAALPVLLNFFVDGVRTW